MTQFSSLEMCAGAGGQALGLERAGFGHAALVELEPAACATLMLNRPAWHVVQGDLHHFDGSPYRGIDLLAGGCRARRFQKRASNWGPTMNVISSPKRCGWWRNVVRKP